MEFDNPPAGNLFITNPEAATTITMFDLPVEIIQHIMSYLPMQDICHLGATCRHGHSLTHDDWFWELHVLKQFGLYFTTDLSTVTEAFTKSTRYPLEGVVYDPNVEGNRELSVICSPEFSKILRERNGKAKQDTDRLLKNGVADARLARFSPILSANTKMLVHKHLRPRVTYKRYTGINYNHEMNNLELMHPIIGKWPTFLMPNAFQALVLAVDTAVNSKEKVAGEVEVMRKELQVFLESQSKFRLSTPLLVLACKNESVGSNYFISLQEIVQGLRFLEMKSPWAGECLRCAVSMRGADKGLDWLMQSHHRLQGQSS
eukprot:GFUD01036566.1.p1 GENE.GFUD01036566.1~~GFUD01036566.1.p1  ORF type:complete len:317 (+),score=66.56 GFUD01036566.1:39-989(+)